MTKGLLPVYLQNYLLIQFPRCAAGWPWLASLVLITCSCTTGYHAGGPGKGYSETKVSPNEFEVTFRGNAKTELERATDFVLLRSAQVTLQHGFSNFAVSDSVNQSSLRRYTVSQQYYTPGPPETALPLPGHVGSSQPGYTVRYKEQHIEFQPGTTLKIKCYSSKPDKPFTYDAAELERSLKQKYKLR
jgi:hypothetical protein